MGPIQYTPMTDPFEGLPQLAQAAGMFRQRNAEANALEAAKQQQAQQQADVATYLAKPTAAGAAGLAAKYPKSAEGVLNGWKALSSEQQDAEKKAGTEVYAALTNGKPDIAARRLEQRIEALKNDGKPFDTEQSILDQIRTDPTSAAAQLGLVLAHVDDKFADNASKLAGERRAAALAPATARKAEADATKAEVAAKYADSDALLDQQKKGWDIKALQADIGFKKESNRIAAMNAAASREGNDLKREELKLKIADARTARDDKLREKVAEAESTVNGMGDTLALLADIKADPDNLAAATGTLSFRAAIPGSQARSMAGKIERLQNSLAAVNLDKLKGAMSDKDILFLKSISSNLDRGQNEAEFVKELDRIEGTLVRGQAAARKKYGMPDAAPPADPNKPITVDW